MTFNDISSTWVSDKKIPVSSVSVVDDTLQPLGRCEFIIILSVWESWEKSWLSCCCSIHQLLLPFWNSLFQVVFSIVIRQWILPWQQVIKIWTIWQKLLKSTNVVCFDLIWLRSNILWASGSDLQPGSNPVPIFCQIPDFSLPYGEHLLELIR